jgi:hypothetical protein
VNTSITELNLESNDLDAEAGKALGKALEVSPLFIVITLSSVMTLEIIFFVFFSIMQVNTSLTDLNLYWNNLGPEGGKAIAKSLEVDLPIFNVTFSLPHDSETCFFSYRQIRL